MQFTLPELGEGVHEGEMIKWKVKVGDTVNYDQSLCEIMTDKATVEIPSAFKGKVQQIHAKEGETVHVGQLLLTFEGTGAATTAAKEASKTAEAPKPAPQMSAALAAAPAAPAAQVSSPSTDIATRALAAPAVRKLANERGVNLATIAGTGPNGRIMREDLDRGGNGSGAASAGAPSYAYARTSTPSGGEERVAIRGLRKKIAEKMRISKDHAAHFTYVEECDATELVKLRAAAKEMGAKQGVKVTYLPFIMKAMVAALRKHKDLNANIDDEKHEIIYKHHYNIGLSIQTEDGLTAPVVKGVEHKGVFELAKEIESLVARARAKKLTQDDFSGGTITLTNAGSIGGLFATPIINYPEVAILGFNKIFRKPVVKEVNGREEIVIRDWTYFSISLDHRVVDGAVAAEFMKTFITYVENPSLMVLESI